MLSLGRFKRIIGLDIGTCLIKAVEARKVGGKLEITNFGTCPTPQGVISNGRVMDPPEVALAVKEALNAGGIRGREVCAAISGGEVIVRHVFCPKMPREELAQAVRDNQVVPTDRRNGCGVVFLMGCGTGADYPAPYRSIYCGSCVYLCP
jgi:Tfp pilus assembly PilM family ATPase